MGKVLSFQKRQQLLQIPLGLRCFAGSFLKTLEAAERELTNGGTHSAATPIHGNKSGRPDVDRTATVDTRNQPDPLPESKDGVD
jgi:hypothetical protein